SGRGFYHLLSWGPRARLFVESGDLGPEFEALVREFEGERHNPRTAHPLLVEYYIAIAHARVHQCLRAAPSARSQPLNALRKALADLRLSAKLSLFKAHRVLMEGYVAWFEGDAAKARKFFSEAEGIAEEQSCPWVLYGIARARAHMLRAEGKADAA